MIQTKAAFIFDLDGTLLDTAPEFVFCLNSMLQEDGQNHITVEALRNVVSFGTKGMVEFAFNLLEADPRFTLLKQRFLDLYAKNLGNHTRYFPGIVTLLQLLSQRNIPWGIVTNKTSVYTNPLVQKFSALNQARCVISGDTLPTSKPDPAPILYACEQLAVQPAQCWYIGDAKTDIEASHRAGVRCVIASYGYIPASEDPATWGADHHVALPEQIADLLAAG
ncbi:MAG: HAD family hydrolase [Candidatus Berkiellales bacterium]